MAVEFEFKENYGIDDLISLVALLRAPDGCPWDREQTHHSIKKNFIEETYEVINAIDNNDKDNLKEELGDVLLQILLHCQMENEADCFDFNDVCDELCKKLIIRHPHVFGKVVAENTEEALSSWDAVKQAVKGINKQSEAMDSIPLCLPALMRAQKIQSKAAKAGFDWDSVDGAFDKVLEEINELKNAVDHNVQPEIDDELGDLLFSCVNISRFVNADSEEALKASTDKFVKRYKIVEELVQESGREMSDFSLDELDSFWERAKEILAV